MAQHEPPQPHRCRITDFAGRPLVAGSHVSRHHRIADFVNGSMSMQRSRRQHRPGVVVPVSVVGWEARAPWG